MYKGSLECDGVEGRKRRRVGVSVSVFVQMNPGLGSLVRVSEVVVNIFILYYTDWCNFSTVLSSVMQNDVILSRDG